MSAAGVYRVEWVPGSDRLRGRCHCAAEVVGSEPGPVWDWLLAHPHGHSGSTLDDHPGGDPAESPGVRPGTALPCPR